VFLSLVQQSNTLLFTCPFTSHSHLSFTPPPVYSQVPDVPLPLVQQSNTLLFTCPCTHLIHTSHSHLSSTPLIIHTPTLVFTGARRAPTTRTTKQHAPLHPRSSLRDRAQAADQPHLAPALPPSAAHRRFRRRVCSHRNFQRSHRSFRRRLCSHQRFRRGEQIPHPAPAV